MSHSSGNPYNPMSDQQVISNAEPQSNHSQQYQAVPLIQENYGGLKHDANSNSPHHIAASAGNTNRVTGSTPNYVQNSNSSPAFNSSIISPPQPGSLQASPHRPPPISMSSSNTYQYSNNPLPPQNMPLSTMNQRNVPLTNASPIPYSTQQNTPNMLQLHQGGQINPNAPPPLTSNRSPHSQPLMNGPPSSLQHTMSTQSQPPMGSPSVSLPNLYNGSHTNQSPINIQPISGHNYVATSKLAPVDRNMKPISENVMRSVPSSIGLPVSSYSEPPVGQSGPITKTTIAVSMGQTVMPSGPQNNVPLPQVRPQVSALPPNSSQGGQLISNISGLPHSVPSGAPSGARITQPMMTPPYSTYNSANIGPPMNMSSRQHTSIPSGGLISSSMQQLSGPSVNSLPGVSMSSSMQPTLTRPQMGPMSVPMRPSIADLPGGPPANPALVSSTGMNINQIPRPMDSSLMGPPVNQTPPSHSGLPIAQQTPRYPNTSQLQRYPSNVPQPHYINQSQMPPMANTPRHYPGQHNPQDVTQRMGQLSVTKQGFNQLWGHQMVDLLQSRHVLPDYPEDPPEIKLGPHFADAPNCCPDIFRCTINRVPETNSLLQKSRLPLGILIHPFKDLNHLPVIQCNTIVRCRSCRTYINPFVYFVDSKRWKCNLCYRVNDLPEEFQYDPVSKSYGDPSRRPEIKSATMEFIAPGEYMLRPPQPAVYLFLLDISQMARESGYLEVFCETLKNNLAQLPGDARTQVGFICFDAHIHYYLMSDGLTRPKEMTVLDIDDVFLPSPESLLVNLNERHDLILELLSVLPKRHSGLTAPACALGAALQAAYKLMAPTGGRVTVFQTCLPNVGPGALTPREDPNARSSKDVAHLNPATDFYKRLALDCSGAQIAVDLFLLNSQYSDLATLSGISKFSGGSVYHIPLFKATRSWQADQLRRMLTRYLTRKIGFEAVMRVRCTRGITIHTFHGNFFVRSTDLLSLPNVSPDAGFGMQLAIEESLSDLQQVCFQAALLYTSSKGERRIRVHTLALPIANTLPDVLHNADQQCIIGLLAKMAVDRCASASMAEAREALINVAVDALSAHRLAQNLPAGDRSAGLLAPSSLKLLPLYLLALLKRRAFRTGTSTRLDDRVADMCNMKTFPLSQLIRAVYPDLYPVHALAEHILPPNAGIAEDEEDPPPDPPRLHLTAERINSTGAYLLDDGEDMILYVGHAVSPAYLSETFGVASFNQVPDESRSLPKVDSEGNALLHSFIDKLNDDRPYPSNFLVLRDNSPCRQLFTERLVDDRVESAFSYYEFLQHIKTQIK